MPARLLRSAFRRVLPPALLALGLQAPTAAAAGRTDLVLYDPPPGAVPSAVFRVTVNGRPAFAEQFKDVAYVRFAFAGRARVAVTAPGRIGTCRISPLGYRIVARIAGATASFELNEPRKLIVRIDGLEKLFIFADPPETGAPRLGSPGVVDVRAYAPPGAAGTQTAALQRAIDAAAARGGGIVYFPRGEYRTGTLYLRSQVSLYLESGALLQGTADPADYRGPRGDAKGSSALIQFYGADNAWIFGRGTLASEGTLLRARSPRHIRLIEIDRCRDCGVRGIVLRDSGGFNVHIFESRHILMKSYKIVNDLRLSNQDGTDPDSSDDVTVDGAFMYTSDDAIAVKADAAPCRNVLVENGVFWTIKSALKIGSDPRHGASAIVFRNNDVVHADRALAIYVGSSATVQDVSFIGDRSEEVGGNAKRELIIFEISTHGGLGKGHIRDVNVVDYTAYRFSRNDSTIFGLDPGHCVENVRFRHLVIEGRLRLSAADAHIRERFARGVVFEH